MKKIKFHLAKIRVQNGLSTRKLAESSNVGLRVIERIQAGTVNPRLETMCKLADALDVTVCDLFTYE